MRGMNGIQLAIFTSAWVLLLTVIGRVLKAKTEDGENFLAVAFAFILFAAVLILLLFIPGLLANLCKKNNITLLIMKKFSPESALDIESKLRGRNANESGKN